MIKVQSFLSGLVSKTVRPLAEKEAKRIKSNPQNVEFSIKRELEKSVKAAEHFADRIAQRFEDIEEADLEAAASRAFRKTAPKETAFGDHLRVAQRYLDEMTGITIVLERFGVYGATFVTAYKAGQEALISDDELRLLKRIGEFQ